MIKLGWFQGFIVGTVVLLLSQNILADSEGATAYQEQHYQEAFRFLTLEAKAGDTESQYLLGTLYVDGLGGAQPAKNGIIWLERAVANRHFDAAQLLGKIYLSGLGVKMNIDKGIYYTQLADEFAAEGDSDDCD